MLEIFRVGGDSHGGCVAVAACFDFEICDDGDYDVLVQARKEGPADFDPHAQGGNLELKTGAKSVIWDRPSYPSVGAVWPESIRCCREGLPCRSAASDSHQERFKARMFPVFQLL